MTEKRTRFARSLIKALDSLQAAIRERTKTINENHKATGHAGEPPVFASIKSEVSLPPAVTAYYQSEQSERPNNIKWARITRFVEFGGIVLLAIYTGVTILLWCSSKDANKIAKDQFTRDQRPYIWLSDKDKPPQNPQISLLKTPMEQL